MKNKFLTLLIFFSLIFSTACQKTNRELSFRREELDFTVDNISLSKSFQSIEPEVKLVKKDKKVKLLASLGVVDCSNIEIKSIVKKGNDINIYTEAQSDKNSSLNVPLVTIDLDSNKLKNYSNFNYHIVSENYDSIPIKFNKSEITKKLVSDFNIDTLNLPIAELFKDGDRLKWKMDFYSVFNKDSKTKELVNIKSIVDADSGDILEYQNETISRRMFQGQALDYLSEGPLVYKNSKEKEGTKVSELYIFNEANKKSDLIFSSKGEISSAQLSFDGNYLSFIESFKESSNIYIVNLGNKLVSKVNKLDSVNPKALNWDQDNKLYILHSQKNQSTIYSYDLMDNTDKSLLRLDFPVESFSVYGSRFLLVESSEDINKNIYCGQADKLKKITRASKASFIGPDNLILLRASEDKDVHFLSNYSIETGKEAIISKDSVRNFLIIDEENLIFSSKDGLQNNYLVNKFNIYDREIIPSFHMIDDNVFFNKDQDFVYISLTPSPTNLDETYIYKVYLDKLSIK